MEEDNFQDHFRAYKGRSSLHFFQRPTFHVYVLLAFSLLLTAIFLIVALCKATELSSDLDQLKAELPKQTPGLDFILFPCGPNNTQWQYFNGNCYYFSLEKCTWFEARDKCIQRRSQLVIIDNMAEQYFLQAKTRHARFWIGFTDQYTEGVWKWIDGQDSSTGFTYWKPGEPNNDRQNEHCAHLWTNGEWNDVYCTYPCYYICERSLFHPRSAS